MEDYNSAIRYDMISSSRDNIDKLPNDMINQPYQLSTTTGSSLPYPVQRKGSAPSSETYDHILVMLDGQGMHPNYSYKTSNKEVNQFGSEFSPNSAFASISSSSSLPFQLANRRASLAPNFTSNKHKNGSQSSFVVPQSQKMYYLSSSYPSSSSSSFCSSFTTEFPTIPETVNEIESCSSAASSISHAGSAIMQPGSPISTTAESSPYSSKYSSSLRVHPEIKAKRSRNGCLTCRQRKKKCCERKPVCTECERLSICCRWPKAGLERKNRSKNNQFSHDLMEHSIFGTIKILRGVVDYKVEG